MTNHQWQYHKTYAGNSPWDKLPVNKDNPMLMQLKDDVVPDDERPTDERDNINFIIHLLFMYVESYKELHWIFFLQFDNYMDYVLQG